MGYVFDDGAPARGVTGEYQFDDERGKAPSLMDVAKSALIGYIPDTAKAIGWGLEKAGVDYGTRMREAGAQTERDLVESMTPGGQRAYQTPVFEGDGLADLRLSDHPGGALAMGAFRSAPQMVATAPIGGPVAAGVSKIIPAAARALPGVRGLVARNAPGALGFGGAEGLQAATLNAEQTQSEIEGMSHAQLKRSPRYLALLETMDQAEARKTLASEAASDVFTHTLPWTGGVGALTGGGALGELVKPGTRSALKGILKGAGEEAVQEAPQSAGEEYIQNLAQRDYVDPAADPWKGVAAAAASGAAIGGVTGGAMGGGAHAMSAARDATAATESAAEVVKRTMDSVKERAAALPAPVIRGEASPAPDFEAQQRTDEARANADAVYTGREAEEQRLAEAQAAIAEKEAAAAAPKPEKPAGVKSMLADPEAMFEVVKKGEGIFATVKQAMRDMPEYKDAKEDAKFDLDAAIDSLQADPQQIFRLAAAKPGLYATIARAAEQTQKLERQPKPAAAAPSAQPKGDSSGNEQVKLPEADAARPAPASTATAAPSGAEDAAKDKAPGSVETIDKRAHEAASSPTNDRKEPSAAQIVAGNAKLGHDRIGKNLFSFENPAGSVREDKQNTPPRWRVTMQDHYGYLKRTIAHDSTAKRWQGLDALVKNGTPRDWKGTVFVVNQGTDDGKFDEHKTLWGYDSIDEAREAYLRNYDDRAKAENRIRSIVPLPMEQAETWAYNKTKKGPRGGELAGGVKPEPVAQDSQAAAEPVKDYAQRIVASGKVKAVHLVGSSTTSAEPKDTDILYELELGLDTVDAVEQALESIDGLDLDRYDTFIKSGERHFHVSSGAGREVVANDGYAKEQEGKPRVTLATARPATERRADLERRKKVAEMAPDEMRQALLTDPLTGLGNRRAYDESEKLPVQVSIDLDSLKWINDNLGHSAGDELLKALGTALGDETKAAYHLSGDEFVLQAETEEAAKAIIDLVQDRLAGAELAFKLPDGSDVTKKGVDFSYGIGSTLEEADAALRGDKEQREAAGKRARRGEAAAGVTVRPAEGVEAAQREAAPEKSAEVKSLTAELTERRFKALPQQAENMKANIARLEEEVAALEKKARVRGVALPGTRKDAAAVLKQKKADLREQRKELADTEDMIQTGRRPEVPEWEAEFAQEHLFARATDQPVGGFYAIDTKGHTLGRKEEGASPRRFKTMLDADAFARKEMAKAQRKKAPAHARGSGAGGMPIEDVRKEADRLTKDWANAPEVIVLAEPAKAPFKAPADALGAFWSGKVYLFAANLANVDRIQYTVFHEILGHHGLRGFFGGSEDKVLNDLAARNEDVRAAAAGWREKNAKPEGWTDEEYRTHSIEEALADMAGKGKSASITGLDDLVTALVRWLRAHGFDKVADWLAQLKTKDLENVLARARAFVTGSSTPHVLSPAQLEPAFATPPQKTYEEQINDLTAGKVVDRTQVITVGGTSDVLAALGLERLSMPASVDILEKVFFDHGVLRRVLHRLPELISDPVMVFDSDTVPGRLVVVTTEVVRGMPLVAIVQPNAMVNHVKVNYITSIYPRVDAQKALSGWMTKGLLRYHHTTKRPVWQTTLGLRLPGMGPAVRGARGRVLSQSDVVKIGGGQNPGSKEAPAFARAAWIDAEPTETQEALRKAGVWYVPPTLKARVQEWRNGWAKRVRQGLVDQFDAIKEYDYKAYILARMTRSADAALEAVLNYGTIKLDADGAVDVDFERGGFLGIMKQLKGEHDRFLAWVIGNRAERLKTEDREHNFTDADIARLKGLARGQMKDGSNRGQLYAQIRMELDRYNKSILDLAEKSGLIDGASRSAWEKDFYVPFYRLMEDEEGKPKGPIPTKGLVNQYAFKVLKGGEQALGDPMENVLRNWSHLIDASLKNQAARASLLAAERVGAVIEADEDTAKQMAKSIDKKRGAVSFVDQGTQRWFVVEDPFLLDALRSIGFMGFSGPAMQALSKFKKWLTLGVTVSPTFRIRNVIRDSLQMIGANPASYNVLDNVLTGWKATKEGSPEFASLLAGGAVMRFGTVLEGDRAAHVKRLIESGVDDQTIVNTPKKVKAMLTQAWDWWQHVGDRAENVNRAALYKKLRAEGKTHLEASFAARDTMDFSMQGTWAAIRFLTQTVPFMNARMQGLYKLGRGAAEDPRRFGIVVGAAALASLALLLAYQDDDDWKAREDWDRETFWWFKIGDKAFRIPKPFEIGAIATLAERGLEYMMTDELTGKQLAERVYNVIAEQLSLNPVPQMLKPMIEVYANRNSFTDRPIETQGMERLSKPMRAGPNTSATAQLLGKNGVLSPAQIDHLVRGYFGWLGSHIVSTTDLALRPAMGLPPQPAWKVDDVLVVGDFVHAMPAAQSKYVTRLYDQMQKVQEAMADLKSLQKIGATEKAHELLEEKGDKIRLYRLYTHAEKQLEAVNRQIKMTQLRQGDADAKREQLDALYAVRNRIAKLTEEAARRQQQ